MKKKYNLFFKLIFLFLFVLSANQNFAQNQSVKITGANLTLKNIFQQIESQTNLSVGYDESTLDVQKKINGEVKGTVLKDVMNSVLAGTNNTAEYSEKYILVKTTPAKVNTSSQGATKTEIKGNVIDEDGNPLIGVTVSLKEDPSQGTITDIDGNYTIIVKEKYPTLRYSYIGYIPREEEVKDRKIINVVLSEDMGQLEEIVVVGYGTQKKASVIGAISSLTPKSIKTPVAKISSQLAGQLSGVLSVQRSGEPGAGADFWIRGISTFQGSGNPLVLVDGIERDMDLVNPEDIKEFSILKDAAATAIYGVRGANGVVLITTRTGEEGAPRISVKAEYGFVSPTKTPKMANALQFAEMYNAAAGYDYYSPEIMEAYRTGSDPVIYPNVDWMNELYKSNSTNTRINANVSGGSKTVRYFISGGYYGENGLFVVDNMKAYDTSVFYRQFNFRSNVDIDIAKYTTLNVNLATTFEQKNEPGTGGGDIWSAALKIAPNAFPMVYPNGSLPGPGAGQGSNPYSLLTQTGYVEKFYNTAQSLIGVTQDFSEYITKGLRANVKFSFDAKNINQLKRTRSPEQWMVSRNDEGELEYAQLVAGAETLSYSESNTGTRMTYLEASVTYNRTFGLHDVGGLFLFQQSQKNTVGNSGDDAALKALPYRNQGIASRVTYNYDQRYFIEGNFGYNGSENFSRGKRFGFFPSVAAGWMLSGEKFFQPLTNVVDMFKLKSSYGIVGNDQIGGNRRFIYLETVKSGDDGGVYYFGNNAGKQQGIRLGDWPNENVGWEESKKFDLGVDISLFNKLKIQADYFHESRTGIFLQRKSIPYYAGISTNPYVNMGEMRNKGFDASLDYHHTINDFHITARGNFTYARNVVLEQDQPDWKYLYRNETGQSRWQQYGYVAMGLFKDQKDVDSWADQSGIGGAEPGDIKYLDLNGDGIINSDDIKAIGYRDVPEIVYGFGASVEWKGFDLNIFFQGNAHVEFSYRSDMTQPFIARNMMESSVYADIYNNYWTPEHTDAKYPRLTTTTNPNNNAASTFWMADGSYIRLKHLEFGYTLPKSVTNRLRIKDVRFYLQGVNLLTFSNFKLWDPDLQTGANKYPPNKVFSLGLSMSF